MEKKKRVTFYVDGFNFYFGLKRAKDPMGLGWDRYYWIDMVKLCESFLGENQILEKVIYFTASPLSRSKNQRQSAFLNANKLINGDRFEIVRGKYQEKTIECPFCSAPISRPEEKKTDVNISVRMIEDCINNATDSLSLISADTDLIPPLELIYRLYPEKKIKVYFPPAHFCHELKKLLLSKKNKPVLMEKNKRRFEEAKMPDIVTKNSNSYTIPEKWR